MDADPLFVLPEHRDYRLLWDSPCIDTGHPDFFDPDDTRSDMGAFFFDQSKPLVHYVSPNKREGTPGSMISVLYTVINCHEEPQEAGWLSKLLLPDGIPWLWNPLEGPKTGIVPASSILQHTVTYKVPDMWPLGTTSLLSMVGLSPSDIFDADTVYFEVVEK